MRYNGTLMFMMSTIWRKFRFQDVYRSRYLVALVNTLIVVMLSYTLAQISWRILSVPESASDMSVNVNNSNRISLAGKPDLGQFASMHLFGNVDIKEGLPLLRVVVPETQLNLVLTGLLTQSLQHDAMAIIAQGSRNEQVYHVGDSLPGDVLVHEILFDRVVLSRAGRHESLTLQRNNTANPESGISTVSRRNTSGKMGELRKELMENPSQVTRLINAEPVFVGEELRGYRVEPGVEREVFSSAGLRPGDVVTTINGISLADTSNFTEIYLNITSAKKLHVLIEREGELVELDVALE